MKYTDGFKHDKFTSSNYNQGMIKSPCLHHQRWVNAEWAERPDLYEITFFKSDDTRSKLEIFNISSQDTIWYSC